MDTIKTYNVYLFCEVSLVCNLGAFLCLGQYHAIASRISWLVLFALVIVLSKLAIASYTSLFDALYTEVRSFTRSYFNLAKRYINALDSLR